jgi:hypothetical protein
MPTSIRSSRVYAAVLRAKSFDFEFHLSLLKNFPGIDQHVNLACPGGGPRHLPTGQR